VPFVPVSVYVALAADPLRQPVIEFGLPLLPLAPVVVWPLIVLELPVLLLEEPIPAPLELLGLVPVVPFCESVAEPVPEELGLVVVF
jgi:hypothetical protein